MKLINYILKNRSRTIRRFFPVVAIAFLALAPGNTSSRLSISKGVSSEHSYDFSNPTEIFQLPRELKEISGLGRFDSEHLLAVQDEKALIYILRIKDGTVLRKVDFGRSGDFEAVEFVGGRAYVLRSDGDIFIVDDLTSKKSKGARIQTRLSSRYDAEGLAYDPISGKLLVACKEYPGKGLKHSRSVYTLDPQTSELSKSPLFLISRDSLDEAVSKKYAFSRFKPAAVAVHPLSGNYYVLSSRDNRLVVLDRAGYIVFTIVLTHKRIRQPEGLAFLNNGDLFLASEGSGSRATLLRFNYISD